MQASLSRSVIGPAGQAGGGSKPPCRIRAADYCLIGTGRCAHNNRLGAPRLRRPACHRYYLPRSGLMPPAAVSATVLQRHCRRRESASVPARNPVSASRCT
jgi:hypothetical protein